MWNDIFHLSLLRYYRITIATYFVTAVGHAHTRQALFISRVLKVTMYWWWWSQGKHVLDVNKYWKPPSSAPYEACSVRWESGLCLIKGPCLTGQQRERPSERDCVLGKKNSRPTAPVTSQSLSPLTPDPQDLWTEGEHNGGPSSTRRPQMTETFNPFYSQRPAIRPNLGLVFVACLRNTVIATLSVSVSKKITTITTDRSSDWGWGDLHGAFLYLSVCLSISLSTIYLCIYVAIYLAIHHYHTCVYIAQKSSHRHPQCQSQHQHTSAGESVSMTAVMGYAS